MKIKLIFLSTMFLALFSCVEPEHVERDRYQLEVAKQQLIPYQKGQKINFIHSKGYAFDFTVVEDTITWSNNNFVTESTPKVYYDSFQVRTVKLVSDYPDFLLTLLVSSEPGKNFLQVELNNFRTNISFDDQYKLIPDTSYGQSKLHESILINNKTYDNVIEVDMGSNKALFYNKQEGLLQIKIAEDETFSINN